MWKRVKYGGGFPGGSVVKNPPAMQDTRVGSLGQEDPLEEEMATHSSNLAWGIPRTGSYSPWGCKESNTTERHKGCEVARSPNLVAPPRQYPSVAFSVFGYIPGHGIAGSSGNSLFNFQRNHCCPR